MPRTKISRLKALWYAMRQRCGVTKRSGATVYEKLGITLCEEWARSFDAFASWALANGYRRELRIDRIDCNGNYCPENCRFVTALENANNKRNNILITIGAETKTMGDWSRDPRCPVGYKTLSTRYHRGWNPAVAVLAPLTSVMERSRRIEASKKYNRALRKAAGA